MFGCYLSSQPICIASMFFRSVFHDCLRPFDLRYIFSIYCTFSPSSIIFNQFRPLPQKLTKNTKMSGNTPALNTPAPDTPATPVADPVLALPSESAIVPLCTELSLVGDRLLRRPDALERLVKKHLNALNG